jgi:hypothetical protein
MWLDLPGAQLNLNGLPENNIENTNIYGYSSCPYINIASPQNPA